MMETVGFWEFVKLLSLERRESQRARQIDRAMDFPSAGIFVIFQRLHRFSVRWLGLGARPRLLRPE